MRIPSGKGLGRWAQEIVTTCTASQRDRVLRGATYRNLFLTADENGNVATYNKTLEYIENLASYIYSPVELTFSIETYGQVGPIERAKHRAAASFLHQQLRWSQLDTGISEAVLWGLVKGKCFIRPNWTGSEIEYWLIQPEMMGVYDESKPTLGDQEAFVFSTWVTPEQFTRRIQGHPRAKEIMRKVRSAMIPPGRDGSPQMNPMLKQIVLGGVDPYQAGGGSSNTARGVVDWLGGPQPTFDPQVMASLLRIDEIWIKDDAKQALDWTTLQVVGDCVVFGDIRHTNIFADAKDVAPGAAERNPLAGMQPFLEFGPNRLDGYFWGRSELCNVALLQKSINARVDGINLLLRMQERPPRGFIGSTSINQQSLAKLNKPGGYFTDANPNMKIESLAPTLPEGLWISLHELERMFDEMGGMPPTMRGRAEQGIRSGQQAETLVRTAGPRFKSKALTVQHQVEELGGCLFSMLQAHVADEITAWVMPKDAERSPEVARVDPTIEQPPAPEMQPVKFQLGHLGPKIKISVDSHSSSPAFSHDTRELLFALARMGAITPDALVQHTHPPGEEELIADLERKRLDQARMLKEHPEMLRSIQGGKRR